ncbi:M1 family metallopeptidase [Albibacterium profundi]|uniref:M1 family metallopeptidase n=1 Tax=Albibacterium profundi TaxID=3134906 RepID=A0ABV5CER5_9SPHI
MRLTNTLPLKVLVGMLCLSSVAFAQTESNYDYVEAFRPGFYETNGNEYRSASGNPGPKYWQNAVDYQLKATLDDEARTVTASVTIDYTNNSPEALDYLWIQLDQNMFKEDAIGNKIIPLTNSRYGAKGEEFDGGYKIASVKIGNAAADYYVDDTRMQVNLPQELKENGGTIQLTIDYSYVVPKYGSDRTGVLETKNGDIYSIAQWYPRMAVFDDILGWNTDPYIGPGEFYLDYGDVDVEITAPSDHFVVLGGELLNPDEVLSTEELKRWKKAQNSDETVIIRSQEEVIANRANSNTKETKTWKYRLENTRDIAWGSSAAFIIDGAKINLQDGKTSFALSAYPQESNGGNAWERSTEYVKASVEHYSEMWFNYPYPVAVNVASNVGGMEYPAIVFCGYKAKGASLWGVTDHEFGHIWFPMIVGSNERHHAWMDEGFNTFLNGISTEHFNDGEYYRGKQDANKMAAILTNPALEPVMTAPSVMNERHMGILAYYKPGFGMKLLRDVILGPERFDKALRVYINEWAYKHPTPEDFFRTMENVSGQKLSWFWRGWFKSNWQLDQAVTNVEQKTEGAVISIVNLEKLPMPVIADITTASGETTRVTLPVEVWERNVNWDFLFETSEDVVKVELDPDKVLPDSNPSNNTWKK